MEGGGTGDWGGGRDARTDFQYFTWGGVDKSWGGVICSLITGSLEFFPDILLLARRNFAHTIQDLL